MKLAIGGTRLLQDDTDFVKNCVYERLQIGDIAEVHVGDCVGVDHAALEAAILFSEKENKRLRICHHRIFPGCNLTAEFPAPETYPRMEFFYLHPILKKRLINRTVGCLSTVDEALLFTHVEMGRGSKLFLKTTRTFGINSTVVFLPSSLKKHEYSASLFMPEKVIKRVYKR